ncbi:MAG TPA: MBL fold metallo-hydrolase [Longimicrobiales bacterium]|nr:MBL fold metallo-hydrolase [Longimicrobiales bacterium]
MKTACLDLRHLDLEGAIAAYVLLGSEPTVIDPGPTPCLDVLREGLAGLGVGARDLRHIVLTHVHLDHAGATGQLVRDFPQATVHVHADGAPHMVDPEKLVSSTRRTFGDAHDRLWGTVLPVPADRIQAWRPRDRYPVKKLRALPTPGHISHHLAYLDEEEGMLFSGDSMGIVLGEEAPTHPPTPPPSVDLQAWERTLDDLAAVAPEHFGATHFGIHAHVPERIRQLREGLVAVERRVRDAVARGDLDDATRYDQEVRERLSPFREPGRVDEYFDMFTAATDWAGVKFYVERNP